MKSIVITNKQVAIVGGGPGGLTLARLLQAKGIAVTVYERDVNSAIRVQGATLDLHVESGLKAIEAAGLMKRFEETYRPGADKGRVVDQQGNIIYDEHDQAGEKAFGDALFRPEIDRADLRSLLVASLQADTVVWDRQLVDLSPVGDGWQLSFKNGITAFADLIIGADGANSKVRSVITPITPFYAGTTILQGNVENASVRAPTMYELLKGGKIYAHVEEKYVHVSAKGDGSIDFYVSLIRPENWAKASGIDFSDPTQRSAWFEDEFSGWGQVWFELFDQTGVPFLVRPQYCVPFDQHWEAQSSITVLGDAAHIAPPTGEGVNLAMLDALELSECLTSPSFLNTQSAIATYEKQMLARGSDEAQVAMDTVAWMHSQNASMQLVQLLTGSSGE
ncbi:FAD-dependent oxidoreductase [Spirosoma endophyticum]|uniref:Flavin-dependent monooxygenase n=1 Tax=Spirosoma endophyticum TaxID=662367 RepID=A0A1I2H2W3_9BACT|nr:NAD(P)/FAD-dependent oxidoreductase [Spirosoma endophyticum]SFF23639.1 2-polyprenyl-6-methoxyphenol hydroxylase [Spirosoma endophyticum]